MCRMVWASRATLAVLAAVACTEPDVRTPGALALLSGSGQQAEVGTALPQLVELQVTDSAGRTVPRVVVHFEVDAAPSGFSIGRVTPASAETDAGGGARVQWTLGTNAGPQTLRAWIESSPGAPISQVELQATAHPGAAASIARASDPVVAITVGDSVQAAVILVDRYGNPTSKSNGLSWKTLDPAVASVSPGSSTSEQVTVVARSRGTTELEVRELAAGTMRFDLRTYVGPGREIAYESDGTIYVLSADGATATALGPGADPAWSPDGRQIAFTSRGTNPGLYVMNADGSGIRAPVTGWTVVPGRPPSEPAWSPDGARIAFVAAGQFESVYGSAWYATAVFVVSAEGSVAQQVGLLPHPRCYSPGVGCGARRPAWSPDGTRLMFTMTEAAMFGQRWGAINLINPDGSGLTALPGSASTGYAGDATWSPDGTRLALAARPAVMTAYPQFEPSRIHVMNRDGTGVTRLTSAREIDLSDDSSPTWAADGRIAFVRSRRDCCFPGEAGRGDLFVMNADGSEVRRVFTMTGGIARPAWRPGP